MFLKFCVTNAIEEFIKMNGLNAEIITLFNRGAIDTFMPVIKQHQLDIKQGAMLIISGTIINAAHSGALIKLKKQSPELYHDLEILWSFCRSLMLDNEHQWRDEALIDDFSESPFEQTKNCA